MWHNKLIKATKREIELSNLSFILRVYLFKMSTAQSSQVN